MALDWWDKFKLRFIEVPRELNQAKRAAYTQGNLILAEGIAKQCVDKLDRINSWKWMWPYPKAKKAYETYQSINEQEREEDEYTLITRKPRKKAA